MAFLVRVFQVSRDEYDSGNGEKEMKPMFEICFHVKEAWNIFEVNPP